MKNIHQKTAPLFPRFLSIVISILLLCTMVSPVRAHATGSADPWVKKRNEWTRHDKNGSLWIEYYINRQMYEHYADLDRVYGLDHLADYVNDPSNRELIAGIVQDCFAKMPDFTGYTKDQVVCEMVNFVQREITYKTDLETTGQEEYARYPVETLYEGHGDCEDSSILLACMLREYGYHVALLYVPGHIAVAIRTDDSYNSGQYYDTENGKFLYIDTTGIGWQIGEIPEQYQNEGARFLWL